MCYRSPTLATGRWPVWETTSVKNARFFCFPFEKTFSGRKEACSRDFAHKHTPNKANTTLAVCSVVQSDKAGKRPEVFSFSRLVWCATKLTRRLPATCLAGQSSESTLLQQRLFLFRHSIGLKRVLNQPSGGASFCNSGSTSAVSRFRLTSRSTRTPSHGGCGRVPTVLCLH